MKPAPFTYHRPLNIDEAARILADVAEHDGRIIAGGQSLAPMMAFRVARPQHLVDIDEIVALDVLCIEDATLRIGARVRHSRFVPGAIAGPTGEIFAKVMPNIANYSVRSRGTFCGSLAHADPASEWCALATLLDAEIIARSVRGERRIPVSAYFDGAMSTTLAPDEIIIEARIPVLREETRTGFYEFSRRKGDFAIAMAIVAFGVENGRITSPRVSVGGAEAYPRRIREAERALDGAAPGADAFAAAAEAAAAAVDPMEDAVTDAAYRRDIVRAATRRALEQAMQ
ncbi:MAG: FAD binding domain-containing protein [Beijerinckiaceae bacterium]|nr:FAD binding domain-containing protein [Beijerinckiaceae bacterium]